MTYRAYGKTGWLPARISRCRARTICRAIRRGGRVAEGARLESVYTGNRIVGSNPTLSASPSATNILRWLRARMKPNNHGLRAQTSAL